MGERRDPEEGSTTLELAILVPSLMIFFLVLVTVARFESAQMHVDTAASMAARAASLARSSAEARADAEAEIKRSLATAGVACATRDVRIDLSSFRAGGVVKVVVTCHAELGDLAGIGYLPLNTAITGSSSEPVDRFRQVTG
jgi:Flp pilus assembly protein TadG